MDYMNYMEKRKHGTAAFPIEYYYVDKAHPRYVMHAHWHREFEMIRILSGTFTVYLNNVEIPLQKDDIVFVECGCLHRGQPNDCVYECVVVDLNMLLPQQDGPAKPFISPMIQSKVTVKSVLSPKDGDVYHTATALFTAMNSTKPYYELSVYGLLFTLISQMYEQAYLSSDRAQSNRQIERIGSVLDWINLHFKEPINSQKLSQISNLNFKYLCKIFKHVTGQTITQYINEQRIEHACYDIAKNGTSITEAAFRNGFNDLSYFAKTFKRHKKMTPREFKTLIKQTDATIPSL